MSNVLKGNSVMSRLELLIHMTYSYTYLLLKWPQSLGQGISAAHSVIESSDTDPLGLTRERASPKLTAHLPTCLIPPLSPPHPKRRPARTFRRPSYPRDRWRGAADRPSHTPPRCRYNL